MDPIGCDELARIEKNEDKRDELESRATWLYPSACEQGDGEACTALGMNPERWPAAWHEKLERDRYARELFLLEQGCLLGEAFACVEAGRLYDPSVYADNGDWDGRSIFESIGRNVDSAVALYRQALRLYEAGLADQSCYELTLFYRHGLDWPADVSDLDACCRHGYELACLHAGLAFEKGDGVKVDLRRARRSYERDCTTGSQESCSALARLYEAGLGGPRKPERAAALYEEACEFADPGACKALSAMVRDGRGVPRSEERAKELLTRRAELCEKPPELCVTFPDYCEGQRVRRDCEP
jgi:TPR repeat protein